MATRHREARMACDAHAAVEHVDDGLRDPHLDDLAD
jgi:hypothetical protein